MSEKRGRLHRFRRLFLIFLVCTAFFLINTQNVNEGHNSSTHVYYGYVPISTDTGFPYPDEVSASPPPPRTILEIINGEHYRYIPPEGTALLDIIGISDGTNVEIWDILAQQMLASKTINRLEKWTYFIEIGRFFKVVADSRVAVFLSGGYTMWSGSYYYRMGAETFYPCSDAGFIGKDFVFMSSITTDTYRSYQAGSNLYIAALEKSDIEVVSSSGKRVLTASLDQYGVGKYFLAARLGAEEAAYGGGGDSIMFHMKSTGKVIAMCVTSRSLTAVPSVTGGFVGRIFYAPIYLTIEEEGSAAAFVVVPIEPGEVTVYDSKFNVVGEKTFSQADIDNKVYWFKNMGSAKDLLIFKSTGDITVMVGCTYLGPTVKKEVGAEDLGDDITFLGAKADQRIQFYVPTLGVVFATKDCVATIDGETKTLKEDEFVLVEQGVHSVKADAEVVIQILAASNPARIVVEDRQWTDWGSYLLSTDDINVSYEVPEGFGEPPAPGMDISMISAVVVVALVAAAAGLFVIRKRKRV
ncbi:MAG: hypothetical protein ACE5NN_06215 [Candidatus Bathyarchaeia archaeon]